MVDIYFLFKGDLYIYNLIRDESFVEKKWFAAIEIYRFYITIIFMVDIIFIYLKEISIFIIYSEARVLWRKKLFAAIWIINYILPKN